MIKFTKDAVDYITLGTPKITQIKQDVLVNPSEQNKAYTKMELDFHKLKRPVFDVAYRLKWGPVEDQKETLAQHNILLNDLRTKLMYRITLIRMHQDWECKHHLINQTVTSDKDGNKYYECDCLKCLSHLVYRVWLSTDQLGSVTGFIRNTNIAVSLGK